MRDLSSVPPDEPGKIQNPGLAEMRLTHWLSVFSGARRRRRPADSVYAQRVDAGTVLDVVADICFGSDRAGRSSKTRSRKNRLWGRSETTADVELLEARALLTAPNPVALGTLDAGNPAVPDGFRFDGVSRNDKSGDAVSGAGDVNGDGFEDFIVGVPTVGQAGGAYVVFGKSGGFASASSLSTIDGTNGFRINGIAVGDQAGEAVGGIGDVNGDGFDDIAVAAYRADSSAGSVWVIFGKSSFTSPVDLASLDGSDGFRLNGSAGEAAGRSVAAAGDINGDGLDDVIIGAPTPQNYSLGSAYVLFGKTGGFQSTLALNTLNGSDGFKVTSSTSGYAGESVAGAGDFNGDGFDDVIIGESYYDGRTYVLFGKSSAFNASIDLGALTSETGFRIEGQYIGRSVSGLGDINGDGFADIVTTAAYSNYINDTVNMRYGYTGQAFVVFGQSTTPASPLNVSGLDGTIGFRVQGATPGDHLGDAVHGGGDVNGDGLDDFVLGVGRAEYSDAQSNFGTGRSYVIFGRTDAFPAIVNVRVPNDPDPYLDGTNGFRLDGQTSGDYAGKSVSILGDVNGDGFDDLLVGAPDVRSGGEYNVGSAYIVLGGDFTAGAETQTGTNNGDTLIASQGNSAIDVLIGGLGDDNLNADGGDDVLIGGEGDDNFSIATGNTSAEFRFDGGEGVDTLNLGGAAFSGDLDLTAIADTRIVDIERISLIGSGTNALTLDLLEVLNISSDSNSLIVRRDEGDTVNVGSGWTNAGHTVVDGINYRRLTQGEAELLIESFVSIDVAPVAVNEGSGSGLIYTFTRTDSDGAVTVNFSIAGSATQTADYTDSGATTFSGGTGTIILPDGSTSATVTLLPVNDMIVEGDEDVTLTVTSATGYNIGASSSATGTIDDNDTAVLSFDSATATASEDAGSQNVVVRLTVTANGAAGTGTLGSEVQINVDDLGTGSATGSDFAFTAPTTLTFVAGSASGTASASVGLTNDAVVEANETVVFALNGLSNSIGGQVTVDGDADDHTLTIDDNDTAVLSFIAATSNPSEGDGTQNVAVNLSITANGVQNSGTLGSTITVDVDRTGGTATAGSDYTFTDPTILTFGSGASSGSVNATVALTNDTVVETDETITFELNGLSSTLDGNVSINTSADDHTLTIDENDTAVFAFGTATSNPTEGVGTHNVAVSLTITGNGQAGTGTLSTPLTVNVADLQSGTANGADFTFTNPTQLTFNSASETKNAPVTITDDVIEEPDETINLELNSLSNSLGGNASIDAAGDLHTVTIAANDSVDPITVQADLRIVHTETSTDANDEAAALPVNANFLDEWDEFFLEVWGRVSNTDQGVDTAHIEIPFSEDRFSIDSLEFGASFAGGSSSSIDTSSGNGRITLDLDTSRTDAGLNNFVLFARVSFSVSMSIPNNTPGQYIQPVIDSRFDTENMTATINGGDSALTVDLPNLQTEVWPVMYDLNDDDVIGFGDVPAFAAAFGTTTSSNASAFLVDFDRGSSVSFGDVSLLATNIGRSKASLGEQFYEADFPTNWRETLLAEAALPVTEPLPGSQLLTGENATLEALKMEAIEQFQSVGLEDDEAAALADVDIIVRDLPGRQLGVVDNNTIVIDVSAAGAGWFTSKELPTAGRYDLFTVIAHELGHILGLDHGNAGSLMDDTLETGVRRAATTADIDEFYSEFPHLVGSL